VWRLAFVTCAACSRILVSAPPARPPDRGPIECTDHSIGPAVDIGLIVASTAAAVAATYYVATSPWDASPAPASFHGVAFPWVFTALVGLAALPFGFYGSEQQGRAAMASCRQARIARDAMERDRSLASDAANEAEARQLRALGLAAAGEAAARRGDCVVAVSIGQRIRAIDPDTFDDYARDLAACH
jgi:hypothetical protein